MYLFFFICSLGLFSACSEKEQTSQETEPETAVEKMIGVGDGTEPFTRPSPALQAQVSGMLTHYLNLKENLVESSAEGTSEAAATLLASLNEIKADQEQNEQINFYKKRVRAIEKFSRSITDNKNLEEQRVHFSALTTQLHELLKAFSANKEPVFYQYCPMAFNNNGGYWLSSSKEILNPYFGEKMLKCGKVTETIRK